MRCKPAEKLLLDYIEGSLPPKRKGQLENHLGKCPHCQKVLVGFEKTLQLAGSLQVNYPPAAVWEDFWPKLRIKILRGAPVKDGIWLSAHKWKIAGVGCLFAAILGVAGLWNYGLLKNPTGDGSASLDERIVQNFMGEISSNDLQQVLSQELQRLEAASLTWSGENLLIEETGLRQSTDSNSFVKELLNVLASEADREYFEDDELTELVESVESRITLASVR